MKTQADYINMVIPTVKVRPGCGYDIANWNYVTGFVKAIRTAGLPSPTDEQIAEAVQACEVYGRLSCMGYEPDTVARCLMSQPGALGRGAWTCVSNPLFEFHDTVLQDVQVRVHGAGENAWEPMINEKIRNRKIKRAAFGIGGAQ